jgi:hypothetical protein
MKNKIFSAATALILYTSLTLAQSGAGGVAINQLVPDESAVLDIFSLEKGVLLPRMTTFDIIAIIDPANGLIVYNIDDNTFHVNVGTPTSPDWISITPDMAVGFLVFSDGSQQILPNTPTEVILNVVDFNDGGHYNGSANVYVVPYDGVYQFNTSVTIFDLDPFFGEWNVEIRVDDGSGPTARASNVSSPSNNVQELTGSVSVTLKLFAGSEVNVYVAHRDPQSVKFLSSSGIRTWLSGHRLY